LRIENQIASQAILAKYRGRVACDAAFVGWIMEGGSAAKDKVKEKKS